MLVLHISVLLFPDFLISGITGGDVKGTAEVNISCVYLGAC